MSVERKLSEDEITEQMRLSLKKELLAYSKDAIPKSQKIDDLIEIWKQLNTETQLKQAMLNRITRILQMLSPEQKLAWIKENKKLLLP